MTAEQINAWLAQHHLIPFAAIALILRMVLRPFFVDVRATGVEGIAIFRAIAKKFFGVTDDEIKAERPASNAVHPRVPKADTGMLAKLFGVPRGN